VIAGYRRRQAVNMLIMRVIDVFYAFPSVLLAVALSGVLGAGTATRSCRSRWCSSRPSARVSESVDHAGARLQDFVEAARASGAANLRIVTAHVLPNVTGADPELRLVLISVAIVLASGLSASSVSASRRPSRNGG
jgi:peptide/nickel transport system permease protein